MIIFFRFTALFSLLATSSLALAGGPLVLEGKKGNTPVTYQNPNVTIHAEAGPLGTRNNAEADALMRDAFALWNDVDTATLNLTLDESQITVDVDTSNFDEYLPNVDDDDADTESQSNADDGLNPVIYDTDGSIIDAFFYEDASLDTVGFAASFFTFEGNFFIEGYAVINGRVPPPPQIPLTLIELKLLVAHEIGHLLGLDHSQININNQETNVGFPKVCTTETQDKYPVMYPFICRNEETLHADDISAISALYPAANFDTSFGIIEGRFVDELEEPVLGANIWAENTVTGDAVSIVSDYLVQGTGFYRLHLPPGSYTLHANSINPLFNGGSSIGPYSLSLSGKSFIDPHPIAEVTLQAEVAGAEVITVTANQTIPLNLSVSGKSVELSKSSGGGSSALSSMLSLLLFSLLLVIRRYDRQLIALLRGSSPTSLR